MAGTSFGVIIRMIGGVSALSFGGPDPNTIGSNGETVADVFWRDSAGAFGCERRSFAWVRSGSQLPMWILYYRRQQMIYLLVFKGWFPCLPRVH